ncbi:MAG: efflux RND transporter permease subunit [Candidatus Krumholzibacteriota bacterium]|nr:efflux RND transporter permease subunit [Candidatus Krumholzibacteriota bacterium]
MVENQADYVNSAIDEVQQTALIGIFLAVLILFVFLRRIGATAIISVSIPISVIATFTLMYFKGLTLNIMTLGGLALGAGMLVDNSIVVVESIVRNIESGMGIKDSAARGTAQVSGAITAATITTIIVFLPIVYIHGVAGELFKDQALTVAFSLLSSLVVAVLVIPMLSIKTLKARPAVTIAPEERFLNYGRFLSRVLKKRWMVIGCSALIVASAALLIPVVGNEFIPDTKTNEFSINLELPSGTELKRTARTVEEIEDITRALFGNEINMIYSVAGPVDQITSEAAAVFHDENTATVKIILKNNHRTGSRVMIDRLSRELSGTAGMDVQFVEDKSSLQSILGTGSAPVVIEVTGHNLSRLKSITREIKEKLQTNKDLFNIETTFEGGRPEIEIHIDRTRAGLYGIGIDDITTQLKNRLMGKTAGSWNNNGAKKDITIRFPESSAGELGNFYINKNGSNTLLSDISTSVKGYAPEEINRRNQKRTGMVSAYYKEGKTFNHVIGDIEEQLSSLELPADYAIGLLGDEKKRRDSFENLKFALLLSIVLVYMVLASQFESLTKPFSILLTIPLAGVGVVAIFLAAGKPLSIMAYIGIIMLAGIAVNDSIILVDTISRIRRAGNAKEPAIIKAARQRIRPIIMTSATTILALLPLTLGFGEGADLRAPMALAVIGGLVTSTILTLVVIPCVYYVLDRSE